VTVRDVFFATAQWFVLDTGAGTPQEHRLRKESAESPPAVK